MSARRFALLSALAMLLMFVASNVIANSWFRAWRLDLTEERLFSLNEGTLRTLDGLSEPIEFKFYYSRDAAAPYPQWQAYAARVREMLQSFAARSHGRIRFSEINVKILSEEEDEAQSNQIEPLQLEAQADPIYFGLTATNSIDDRKQIPAFRPEQEAYLEYQLTRLVYELDHPNKIRVALITSLPIDPAAAADPSFPAAQSWFASELGRMAEVEKLVPDFTAIPDADVLAIIHPAPLTPAQAYAIDQFMLRNGRAFIALDPAAMAAQDSGGFNPMSPTAPPPTASTLDPLLQAWGVTMAPTVVLDAERALQVQQNEPPLPLFFAVPAEETDREDLVTARLNRGIFFGLAGGFTWNERAGLKVTTLAQTSGATMRLPAEAALARPSPYDIHNMWQAGAGRREAVALRLSGNLTSAFAQGAPAPEPAAEGDATAAPAPAAAHLTSSQRPAEIVLVADVDFLTDQFFVQQDRETFADNGAFALNAIDILGGSGDLASLRARAPKPRTMEVIDRMEGEAQLAAQGEIERLEGERQNARERLAALQRSGAEMPPEISAEIVRWRDAEANAVKQLRNVGRDLRADVDGLKALLVFLNMWLAPMLVAGMGLFFVWRRQRRGGARR
jgi:ABC-2 type transport system permease protein